jgi:glycosyltransferase involved in cell wall biosynthesis
MSISFILPTIGRPTLTRTLNSIQRRDDDEILVAGYINVDDPRPRYFQMDNGRDWGRSERLLMMQYAKCEYLAFIDDDDWYTPDARQQMEDVITTYPGRPVLFRMKYPNGIVIWADEEVRCGNVSTQMILIPNQPEMFGTWTTDRAGDFQFLNSMKWPHSEIVWARQVTVNVGHNEG